MSRLLINEPPLQVLPSLAVKVGLQEAIVLQQVHYWLQATKPRDGSSRWVFNTYEQWAEQFPFWSPEAIRKIFKSLRDRGLIVSRPRGLHAFDRVNEYTIDYAVLEGLHPEESTGSSGENRPVHPEKFTASERTNLPTTRAETTTETTTERASRKRAAPQKAVAIDEAWLAATHAVPVDTGAAWLALRRAKRLPLTVKAWELTAQDGASVGLTAEQTVTACVRRGWAAFRADWWLRDQNQSRGQESFRERDARLAAERVREMTGGLGHDRAALGDPLPFERGYVPPQDVIEGEGHVRRIR